MFDYEKKVLCEVCKTIFYCSDKCKEEDKELHERDTCRPFSKEMELFQKWYESEYAVPVLSEVATHAMSKEESLSNDLEFFISINLRFCGRYCSFDPIEPPKNVYKSHMKPTELEYMNMIKKKVGSLNLCQKNNFSDHLQEWAAEAKESGVLVDFVLASLGYQSEASQKSSENYTVIIEFEFGEQFGEIKGLLSHDIMDISGSKDSGYFSKNASNDNHVVFYLTMACRHGSGFGAEFPIQISIEQINAFQRKDYDDEVTGKFWQALLKVPFPECPPTPEYPDI